MIGTVYRSSLWSYLTLLLNGCLSKLIAGTRYTVPWASGGKRKNLKSVGFLFFGDQRRGGGTPAGDGMSLGKLPLS